MEMSDCYLPKGHVLNQRYEVFDVIGSGGFGITYRAFDLLLNRFVAVKEFYIMQWMERCRDGRKRRIRPSLQKSGNRAESCRMNFHREAKIMENLKNIPYLSRIQENFSENNTEYIVMKLLEGESMMHYTKMHGKIHPQKLFPMIEQVLFAVEQTHECGFIHRDISPANMICTKDGDLYLIDFGAATSCDRNSELWNEQVFSHKGFEAPEHLLYNNHGTWTDIYSLCASVVYLLTGEGLPSAKEREKADCIPQILMRSGLSGRQQNILMKGLAIDSRRRCASAKELRMALCGETVKFEDVWDVAYTARTDIGSRKMNQDNLMVDGLFCYEGEDFRKAGQIICMHEELHMAAVCDGVGGACLGELASRAAAQALMHFMEQYRYSHKLPERLIDELLDQMNEKVASLGKKIGTVATTLSLLLWKGNHYWAVNIGDSPIYLLRKRKISRLSVPHTRAYAHFMSGRPIGRSDWHVLMNYLGKEKTAGSQMAAIRHGHLQKGDVFLICSDGVTDHLDEAGLKRCLLKGGEKGMESIWKVLNCKDSNDNCSAVIVCF